MVWVGVVVLVVQVVVVVVEVEVEVEVQVVVIVLVVLQLLCRTGYGVGDHTMGGAADTQQGNIYKSGYIQLWSIMYIYIRNA